MRRSDSVSGTFLAHRAAALGGGPDGRGQLVHTSLLETNGYLMWTVQAVRWLNGLKRPSRRPGHPTSSA